LISGWDFGYGEVVRFVFGEDEHGEYLDFLQNSRFSDNIHMRIREDGTMERLETAPGMWLDWMSKDAKLVERVKQIEAAIEEKFAACIPVNW
jgi:hypothetical protein